MSSLFFNISGVSVLESDAYAELKEEQEALDRGDDIFMRETLERFARAIDELYQKVDELDRRMMID